MLIVGVKRGTGYDTDSQITYAEAVTIQRTKDETVLILDQGKADIDGDNLVRFAINTGKLPNGNWEHWYIKDSRTGNIIAYKRNRFGQ